MKEAATAPLHHAHSALSAQLSLRPLHHPHPHPHAPDPDPDPDPDDRAHPHANANANAHANADAHADPDAPAAGHCPAISQQPLPHRALPHPRISTSLHQRRTSLQNLPPDATSLSQPPPPSPSVTSPLSLPRNLSSSTLIRRSVNVKRFDSEASETSSFISQNAFSKPTPLPAAAEGTTCTPSPAMSFLYGLGGSGGGGLADSFFSRAPGLGMNELRRGVYGCGDQIGEWVLAKELGRGSFSRVYEAHLCDDSNQRVAIKIIKRPRDFQREGLSVASPPTTLPRGASHPHTFNVPPPTRAYSHPNFPAVPVDSDASDPAKIERLMDKETRIWASLSHPNILQVLDLMEVDDALCIVSELALGGTLLEFLNACFRHYSGVSEHVSAAMMRQLVQAVAYLHSEAVVVHRDLKLENVMILEDWTQLAADGSIDIRTWIPTLKVIDFGLAEYINGDTNDEFEQAPKENDQQAPFGVGSLHYCSPEDLRGLVSAQNGESSDIWALGCMLFAMLTGTLPFNDGFLPRLQQSIINGSYDEDRLVRANVSDSCRTLLKGILEVDVSRRLGVIGILESEWMVSQE